MAQKGFKRCPFCGEDIREEAVKCRFCGEFIENPEGGKLSKSEQARQVPQGHAVGTDTEIFFEGNISRIAMVGPTVIFVFGIIIAILVGVIGEQITRGPEFTMVKVLTAVGIAIVAILYWLFKWLDLKNKIFRITNDRIEYEHGVFGKSIHNMDMWRVQDIAFNQSLIQRILGIGRILILSSDKDTPVIKVGPIAGARDLYDKLKKVQLEADRQRGVVHIEQ